MAFISYLKPYNCLQEKREKRKKKTDFGIK